MSPEQELAVKTKSTVQSLINQRDSALNDAVNVRSELAVLTANFQELQFGVESMQATIASLENRNATLSQDCQKLQETVTALQCPPANAHNDTQERTELQSSGVPVRESDWSTSSVEKKKHVK